VEQFPLDDSEEHAASLLNKLILSCIESYLQSIIEKNISGTVVNKTK